MNSRMSKRIQPKETSEIRYRRSRSAESYIRTVSVPTDSSFIQRERIRINKIELKITEPTTSRTAFNDGFTVDIKIGNKHLNASVNSHRKVTIINRSVFKILNWNACPANYDIVTIPICAGTKTLEIMCVANYQLNVPLIWEEMRPTDLDSSCQ